MNPNSGMVNDDWFSIPIRVYYENTDAGGVVYHSDYLNFMERSRTEWLRRVGLGQKLLREALGILFVVARVEVKFHAPAQLDDLLWIRLRPSTMKRRIASLNLEQEIIRDSDGTRLVSAKVVVACINEERKPTPIPDRVIDSLNNPE
ncbi:tol-pal system-associated acyl-CoA thioesterase [Magnetococcales bacterium HHB-1]